MNTFMRRLLLVSVLAASGLLAGDSLADNHSQRQYYGSWQKHPQGYSYRSYYYKPSPTYSGYKHHYVIHHPKKPDHFYYYNPYQKQFWGRCPVAAQGKPVYSKLADKDRNADLNKIPEAAFPAPDGLPPFPNPPTAPRSTCPPTTCPARKSCRSSRRRTEFIPFTRFSERNEDLNDSMPMSWPSVCFPLWQILQARAAVWSSGALANRAIEAETLGTRRRRRRRREGCGRQRR